MIKIPREKKHFYYFILNECMFKNVQWWSEKFIELRNQTGLCSIISYFQTDIDTNQNCFVKLNKFFI